MGLDVYLWDGSGDGWEPDPENDLSSEKYPEHLFKRNYLRSSYNDSGINQVLGKMIGLSLYDIFQVTMEAGEFYPSAKYLKECRVRAKDALDRYNRIGTYLMVETVVPHSPYDKAPPTLQAEQALAHYREVMGDKERSYSFSNGTGHYYGEGEHILHVCAAIKGQSYNGAAAVHLIYEMSPDSVEWYRKALEITIEFLDYALTLDTPAILWSA